MSKPGGSGPAGQAGISATRALSDKLIEDLRQGKIRFQTIPNSQLQQQPKYIRIVSSGNALATNSTPIKVLHTVPQQHLTTLVASPQHHAPATLSTGTRTIKIQKSPNPSGLQTTSLQPSTIQASSLLLHAPSSSVAQRTTIVTPSSSLPPASPSSHGGISSGDLLNSQTGESLGSRPGKRSDIDFESFTDSKRRKTDKGGKGLRHFSMKVCEKVKAKGTTSYNEVADELVSELTDPRCQSPSDQQYDQKNIRRRVYDALNVLMAMNIISKEKKEIRWLGLPTNSVQEATSLDIEKSKKIERIKAKTEQLQDLILQQIAFKKLVERNKEAEKAARRPTPNSVIEIPFIIVSTSNKTVIECGISQDKKEYLFDFDNTFEIHDDMFVLKKMNMAMGLEKPGGGQVSDDDLAKARSMVPQALEPYVEQLAKHGPGSYSMPKVTMPKVPRIKEDPESPDMFGLDQDDDDDDIE